MGAAVVAALGWDPAGGRGFGAMRHGIEDAGAGAVARARDFLDLTRHEWGDIHFWIAIALVGGMLLHLALHYGWIKAACPRYLLPRFQTHLTS